MSDRQDIRDTVSMDDAFDYSRDDALVLIERIIVESCGDNCACCRADAAIAQEAHAETERLYDYISCLERGLSAYEARAEIWPLITDAIPFDGSRPLRPDSR
jgi:hypothetical protein